MTMTPEKIDRHVGGRLRLMRSINGFTQEYLAKSVGLTFQQIQKYEQGTNRISASKLWQFSELLGVSPNDFYDGLDQQPYANGKGINRKVAETAMCLQQIEDEEVRHRVVQLIQAFRTH